MSEKPNNYSDSRIGFVEAAYFILYLNCAIPSFVKSIEDEQFYSS
jgi:hypothetical protein